MDGSIVFYWLAQVIHSSSTLTFHRHHGYPLAQRDPVYHIYLKSGSNPGVSIGGAPIIAANSPV